VTPERWQKLEDLYHQALAFDQIRRDEFLKQSCGGDEDLRKEVESLLAQEKEAEHFIESPALRLVSRLVAGPPEHGRDLTGSMVSHYRIIEKLVEQDCPQRYQLGHDGLASPA
jgi:eukaryotic-like serine/threonine-protein kinase